MVFLGAFLFSVLSAFASNGNSGEDCKVLLTFNLPGVSQSMTPAPEVESILGGDKIQKSPDKRYALKLIYPEFSTKGPNVAVVAAEIVSLDKKATLYKHLFANSKVNTVRASWSALSQGIVALSETNNSQQITTIRYIDLVSGKTVRLLTRNSFEFAEVSSKGDWLFLYDQDGLQANIVGPMRRQNWVNPESYPVSGISGAIAFARWNPDPVKQLLVVGTFNKNLEEYPEGYSQQYGYESHRSMEVTVWKLEGQFGGAPVLTKKFAVSMELPKGASDRLWRKDFGWSLDGKVLYLGRSLYFPAGMF